MTAAVYQAPAAAPPTTLVVVLHGDAPFTKPDYQNRFAAAVALRYPVVAAAILRPGYTDPAGHTSEGERGEATGDSYNSINTDALAGAILALRTRYKVKRVVLVGHSGGAALSANILSRHPAISSSALLISCPCDVTAWRGHMLEKTKFAGFDGPVETLSPVEGIDQLAPEATIVMLVGEIDDVTPPSLTDAYAAKARKRGLAVTVERLPGEGHEILPRPRVLEALGPLLR